MGYTLYRSEGDDRYTSEIEDIPLPKPPTAFLQKYCAADEIKRHFDDFEWDEDLLTTEPMTRCDIQQGNVKVCPTCCKWYIVHTKGPLCGLYSWIAEHGTCPNCNAPLSLAQLKTIPYEAWDTRYGAWLRHEYVNAHRQHVSEAEAERIQAHIQRNKQLEPIKEKLALVMPVFFAYCVFVHEIATMRAYRAALQTELEVTKGFKVRRRVLQVAIQNCEHVVSYDEKQLCPTFTSWVGDIQGKANAAVPAMLDTLKSMEGSFRTREAQIRSLLRDHQEGIAEVKAMESSPCWPKLRMESCEVDADKKSLTYTCYIFFSETEGHTVVNTVC